MTECEYKQKPASFGIQCKAEPFFEIDILKKGRSALEEANMEFGLALDQFDVDLYFDVFANKAKRNPTNVELFDLAQSNSEHSRHWFFKGRFLIDNVEMPESLFSMVMKTQESSNQNNVIKFCDNSSAIQGCRVATLTPADPSRPSPFGVGAKLRHITYTAETHNFPTGVCPFPGAATGTGGRIRDGHAAGRGSHVIAGLAGYSFGNLNIPGYEMEWEDPKWPYPTNFASPLDICIQASNGASDYGNKFGEPVICGFARSFGQILRHSKERIEYIKPIMFSGGVGTIDDLFLRKMLPDEDMFVAKIGGPVYRIGVGGGSASSVDVQNSKSRSEKLDFSAVQRGDAQMGQKLNRVVRASVESPENPILAIHDQGAGGNGNVLKEIVEGSGATILADEFQLGDPTLNSLELWGAEYQESDAILLNESGRSLLEKICDRERCTLSVVGKLRNDNRVILVDFGQEYRPHDEKEKYPVDLNLDWVLGKVPRKTFTLNTDRLKLPPLLLPQSGQVLSVLQRVLKLPSVASKRYLTNKVDRSITGLVAQQQCVGPLHTPLADVAVTALSYFETVGSAVALGEQPIKMLIDPSSGARMTVGEALTNLLFAPISSLQDVKCSANWMWPAKLAGEGEKLYAACQSMCHVMCELGIAVDGGKDSLSMATVVHDEVVKSPGTLVVSAYAQCTDVSKTVTPDLKCPDDEKGALYWVSFARNQSMINRLCSFPLGGTALAQTLGQLGNETSDLGDVANFIRAFQITQDLIKNKMMTAGHDISDGGLITSLLEMAFAGNCGLLIDIKTNIKNLYEALFNEELGILIECEPKHAAYIEQSYQNASVSCNLLGFSMPEYGPDATLNIKCGDTVVLRDEKMTKWRMCWEETSLQLEKFQCNSVCVDSERKVLESFRKCPTRWDAALVQGVNVARPLVEKRPKVAVLREEGSNGDREMGAAFFQAGFEVWDVCMQDLLSGSARLDLFQGLAFVGGFSYADVFGAAKGWASSALFNKSLRGQFDRFYNDERKFSFGACNGCQLMALLGWVGGLELPVAECEKERARNGVMLDVNESGRFESRFAYVKIEANNQSIMLKGMLGAVLGVWVAHGEGRFVFRDGPSRADQLIQAGLVPLRYVDCAGQPTQLYPFNPNGSERAVAALCSPNGRHLAIMPHPERAFLRWQWPHYPPLEPGEQDCRHQYSPWMRMFLNAHDWCASLSAGE